MEQYRVGLQAPDTVSLAGLISYLRPRPELVILEPDQHDAAQVMVVVTDVLNPRTELALRRAAARGRRPVILILDEITEAELMTLTMCGVVSVLARTSITDEQVVRSVLAAVSGEAATPDGIADGLLRDIERLQQANAAARAAATAGLTDREMEVLRLMSEGLDTAAVALALSYSERTVKKVVQRIVQRHQLRNRTHAIAYAVRAGLI